MLREALSDFFYNSWRFLGANLLLGTLMVLVILAAVASPVALLAVLFLVPVAAGMMRMATRLIRDGHSDFSDFTEVVRRPWRILALGALQLVVTADAMADIVDILSYLHREAGNNVAEHYGNRFGAATARITEFPESAAARPDLGQNARISVVPP